MTVSVGDISTMLAPQAEDIARELLPGGERAGSEWKVKRRRSPTGYAIVVVTRGPKQGLVMFYDGADRGGDLIDLIAEVKGLTKAGAIQEAKARLGLADAPNLDERTRQRLEEDAERRRRAVEEEERATTAERLEGARSLWSAAEPVTGTLAERYLIARGIPPRSRWPVTIGFIPSLRHRSGGRWPCLVCRRQEPDGSFAGVWRIYLARDGSGKAPVPDPPGAKMGLGNSEAGAVRLAPAAETIAVAEGVETAFAVQALRGDGAPVWATLSTSGMMRFQPPPEVRRVLIYADGDLPRARNDGSVGDPPGLAAAKRLSASLEEIGVISEILEPPPGRDFLDLWNLEQRLKYA